ncbi:MAG: T9SS type A sorting domain-containing protein [Cytophagaceae bacterium]|nr:T9SS type A sorting domain-containing protein [Cytophagaceae bacterium]
MTLQRTATGPANIVVSYQNSGDAEVFTAVNSLSGTTDTPFSIPINFINNGAPIVFKIYGYNGTAAGGHLRLKSLSVTGSVPLPVNLTNFTGKNKPTSVFLNWSTASETNFSHFIVQKSKDAKGFENIGRIESAGFDSEKSEYSFIDEKPFAGNNYYRLKMVDKDGSEDYSKMISVNFDGKALAVFYPNPTQDFVRFENIKTEDISSVVVHKINGEFLGETHPTTDGIDISGFKSRELILQLKMKNNQTITSRIIKNL